MKPHTTHHACPEQLAKYGGQTVGCCCTGHNCKPDPATHHQEEEDFTYLSAVLFFSTGFVAFILTLIIILLIKGI